MQNDLNELEVGSKFMYTTHTAQLLAILCVMMTYAPGLPVLTLLMTVVFKLYFNNDKIMLLRYHRRPPATNHHMMAQVIYRYLPFAVIIRLCFAIFMFSSSDNILSPTFPVWHGYQTDKAAAGGQKVDPSVVSMTVYQNFMETYVQSQPYYIPFEFANVFEDRVKQSNVFPLVVLLVLTILFVGAEYVIYHYFYKTSIRIIEILKYIMNGCQSAQQSKQDQYLKNKSKEKGSIHPFQLISLKDPLRIQAAPFTGIYYQFLGKKRDSLLNRAQEDGEEGEETESGKKKGCCTKFFTWIFCGCKCCCKCCRRKKKKGNIVSDDDKVKAKPEYEDLDDDLELGLGDDVGVTSTSGRNRKRKKWKRSKAGEGNEDEDEDDEFLEQEAHNIVKNKRRIKGYEYEEGWEVTEMGLEYEVKVKVWSNTEVGPDGVLHNKGQHKRTFEVLADHRCHTYQLQFVPSYKLAYLALRDQDFSSSLVDDFGKRKSILQKIKQFDPREAEIQVINEVQESIVKKKDEKFMKKIEQAKDELKNKSAKVVPIDSDSISADADADGAYGELSQETKEDGQDEIEEPKKSFFGKLFSNKKSKLSTKPSKDKDQGENFHADGGTRPSSRSTTDNLGPAKRLTNYSSESEEEDDDKEDSEEEESEEEESSEEESSEEEDSEEEEEEEEEEESSEEEEDTSEDEESSGKEDDG